MNEEVTQCNVLQTAGRIAAIPFRVLSQRRVSPEIHPTGTIHHRSRRKKGHGGGNIKKEGTAKGERKTERKEQVLVLKRAAMRGNGRARTDWVVLSPLIVSRSTRTVHKGQRRAKHRMVSACDGSLLQGSVKSHPDARPPAFISVSADAKASIKK